MFGENWLGPQPSEEPDLVVKLRPTVGKGYAQCLVLNGIPANPYSEPQPPAAKDIEIGSLLAEQHAQANTGPDHAHGRETRADQLVGMEVHVGSPLENVGFRLVAVTEVHDLVEVDAGQRREDGTVVPTFAERDSLDEVVEETDLRSSGYAGKCFKCSDVTAPTTASTTTGDPQRAIAQPRA